MFEIGNSLREARLRQQLDFPEVEVATKIRSKYLRALEEEQFEVLPAQTYIKGFLRSYAEYLGLDGQLYVDEYNSRYVTGENEPPLRPRRSSSSRRTRPHRRIESHVILATVAGIGVVTALVIAAWKFGGGTSERASIPNLAQAPVVSVRSRPAAKPAVAPTRAVHPQPRPVAAHLLVTAVNGSVWLEVRAGSQTGRLIYRGTLGQGRSRRFVAQRLWVNVGAPGNLALRLNGKAVAVPGTTSPLALSVTGKGVAPA